MILQLFFIKHSDRGITTVNV